MSDAAISAQIRAADPTGSSWVSANAGTGKTRVLTDRVARLLLRGTEPQKILCLTYTKAAAAEMQNRLFRTLGSWSMLPDADLAAALTALGEPGAPDLAQARTLFARALETPGGLRIQTIHAFCEALIRRFPLEAGVAPGFAVLEDRQARALRDEILDELAAADPAGFAGLARQLPADDPDPLLLEIGKHRAAFAAPFDPAALADAIGARPELTPEALAARVLPPEDEALLRALIPHLAAGKVTDCKAGETLAAALAATDPDTRLSCLEAALLTGRRRSQGGQVPHQGPPRPPRPPHARPRRPDDPRRGHPPPPPRQRRLPPLRRARPLRPHLARRPRRPQGRARPPRLRRPHRPRPRAPRPARHRRLGALAPRRRPRPHPRRRGPGHEPRASGR